MRTFFAVSALPCDVTHTFFRATLPAILCLVTVVSAAENPQGGHTYKWRVPEGKTHILWIGGGHWHDTLETTAILRRVLERTGRYHVTYSEDTSVLTRLDRYDVVVLNGMFDSLESNEKKSLLSTVQGGKPLLVLHAASACFRKPPPARGVNPPADHPEFYKMLGGYVQRHPPFGPVSVHVMETEHAITKGLTDFAIEDELFLFGNLEPDNHVLLEADYKGERRPLAWTRHWGGGRVFHLALGHNGKAAMHASFQRLMVQGLDWLSVSKAEITAKRLGKGIVVDVSPRQGGNPLKVLHEPAQYDTLKAAGFQSIRIYVVAMMDPVVYKTRIDDALDRGLAVVISMWGNGQWALDPQAGIQEFVEAWGDYATYYRDYPDGLVFDLWNEPAGLLVRDGKPVGIDDGATVMAYLNAVIPVIRKTNSSRTLGIGGPGFNGCRELEQYVIPKYLTYKLEDGTGFEDDSNIIGVFHMYHPQKFTHWIMGLDQALPVSCID